MQVNTNGILSFRGSFVVFTSAPFPFTGLPLIAPFWDDVDTRNGGTAYYRETANSTLLERFKSELVAVSPLFASFEPSSLFLATWDHVAAYATSKTSTVVC